MAAVFGDMFAYRTNTRFVPAVAISAEYGSGTGTTGLVDLVLLGTNNGQRLGVSISYTGATASTAATYVASPTLATAGVAYLVDTNN
jgi:hypothetical protein